jgi:hypothetical protein
MADCEFNKYGCGTKLANADHVQAHSSHHMSNHLRLITSALDTEVEKNKSLTLKIAALERTVKENGEKFTSRLDEIEAKWKTFQGMPIFTVPHYLYLTPMHLALVDAKLAVLAEDPPSPPITSSGGTIPSLNIPLSSSSGDRLSSPSLLSPSSSAPRSSSPSNLSPIAAAAAKSETPRSTAASYRLPSRTGILTSFTLVYFRSLYFNNLAHNISTISEV